MNEPKPGERSGTCYWLTGLSGAGKSSIGTALFQRLRAVKPNVLFLDGDLLREVFGKTHAYDLSSRKALALTYGKLCRMLTQQGQDVVCCTISMFDEVRAWNRENIPRYREIYVRASMETLVARDQKQLYSKALRGEVKDVMGVDMDFEAPLRPDWVIENEGGELPDAIAEQLFLRFYLLDEEHDDEAR